MKNRLIVKSETQSLDNVYGWITKLLTDQVNPKQLRNILLISQEMVTNSILHGNKNNIEKKVIIEIEINKDEVIIEIEDEGKGLNQLPSKEEAEELDYLAENGRGLKLAVLMTKSIELNGSRMKLIFNKGTE